MRDDFSRTRAMTKICLIAASVAIVTASAISDASAQSRAGTRCPNNGYYDARWYCNVFRKTLGDNWRQQIRQIRAGAATSPRSP
jgi:hypothetical protein